MKNRLVILSMLFAMTFFWLPSDNTVSAQDRQKGEPRNGNNGNRPSQPGRQRQVWQGNDRRKGPKWNHGYKNYGQYRRTQVGNRRYRLMRRSYWQNGTRITRWIRVYN